MGGRERGKKGAGHPRLVGGSFTKQRELSYEACLGRQRDDWIPSAALQFPKVYKEALTVLSHVYHAGVFNTMSLSQGCVHGAAPGSRKDQQNPHSKDGVGGGAEPPRARVQLPAHLEIMSF